MECLFPQESPSRKVRYLDSPIFSGACRELLLVKKGDILNSSKRNFDRLGKVCALLPQDLHLEFQLQLAVKLCALPKLPGVCL